MRKAAALVPLWMLTAALVLAQSSPSHPPDQGSRHNPKTGEPSPHQPQGGSATNSAIVAAGAEIRATLDTPLSTRTSRPGDRFTATIQEPVRAADGGSAVPSGSLIHGQVAQANSGEVPGPRKGGRLSLRFDELVLADGTRLPLSATLLSVRQTTGTAPARTRPVAGSIAGLTFEAPMKGLTTSDGAIRTSEGKDVNLPANSGLVLRLDQPLTVPGTAAAEK